MEHNPITTGDLAMAMASDEAFRRRTLEQELRIQKARTDVLEAEVDAIKEWSNVLADRLNEALLALAVFVRYEPIEDFSGQEY